MDFDFRPEEKQFREDVQAFLKQELPDWWRGLFSEDDRVTALTRQICEKLAARGWLTISWPREYGGAAENEWKQAVIREEMWANDEPRGPQYMNLNYIGPMIMKFGTPEQKARFLPPMAAGKVIWCQGFSEPGAGSDLASLRTRADDAGDHFVINGSKIWTSYADFPADFCMLLARTDQKAPKHKGISVFALDMRTRGITVRPIRSMGGPRDFNEVFFDEVAVPRDCLLGNKNEGWMMVVAGLSFERVGVARYAKAAHVIEMLVDYARNTVVDGRPLAERPDVRAKIADLYCRCQAARLLNYRAISMQAKGQVPSIEGSIARVHNTLVEQFAGQAGLDIIGPSGQIMQGDPLAPIDGRIERQWIHEIAATIAAGTIEVQKNIIAQRGLSLPKSE
ncbi:MAG: acyl-CoA dehydrogenase family protein [Candidatus Binataceae bacterium]